MKGSYRVNKDICASVGNTVFTYPEGRVLHVKQHDKNNSKVLIDFGDGYIEWFHETWLKRHATKAD